MNDKRIEASWQEWRESFNAPFPEFYFEHEPWWLHLPVKERKPVTEIDYVRKSEYKAINWLAYLIGFPAIRLLRLLGRIRQKKEQYSLHIRKSGEF